MSVHRFANVRRKEIKAKNNDIDIRFYAQHIGPAVRVSANW